MQLDECERVPEGSVERRFQVDEHVTAGMIGGQRVPAHSPDASMDINRRTAKSGRILVGNAHDVLLKLFCMRLA